LAAGPQDSPEGTDSGWHVRYKEDTEHTNHRVEHFGGWIQFLEILQTECSLSQAEQRRFPSRQPQKILRQIDA
jgi:hypothetical protein